MQILSPDVKLRSAAPTVGDKHMDTKVARVAATPGSPPAPQPPSQAARRGAAEQPEAGSDAADLRLIIEEDQASGLYVYKTVNRLTGEVILTLPRADILRLREARQYVPGTVIRTEA